MSAPERLPADFLAKHRDRRVVFAFAQVVMECGYRRATVTDIVRQAGIARNTFYDTFSSKEAVAWALVKAVAPAARIAQNQPSLLSLAVELAAPFYASALEEGRAQVLSAENLLRALAAFGAGAMELPKSGDPLTCTLPPGRHGLPREFVRDNQRLRLLLGVAEAIAAVGYYAATIGDVTRAARVSRRTFYEHFDSKDEAAQALVFSASPPLGEQTEALPSDSGLAAVAFEAVATRVGSGADQAGEVTRAAGEVVQSLAASFEGAEEMAA